MTDALASVLAYHEATKHHLHQYARSLGYMDWDKQPDPFRSYDGAERIALRRLRAEDGQELRYDSIFNEGVAQAARLDLHSISQLMYDSLALSAWKDTGEKKRPMRVNPSSGNLHPTEAYLLTGPVDGITETPMVAHYAPKVHALEKRTAFSDEVWRALTQGLPEGTILIGLTSIYWREAWKYGERAFRYCHMDVGHAIGALCAGAAGLGWQVNVLEQPGTEELQALFGLRESAGVEVEHLDCLLAVCPRGASVHGWSLSASTVTAFRELEWEGVPNRLSADHQEWEIIEEARKATRKPSRAEAYETARETKANRFQHVIGGSDAVTSASMATQAVNAVGQERTLSLRQIIRQRRSAYEMDGVTTMSRDAFYSILARTMKAEPFAALPWEPLAHLAVFVHRVEELAAGIYMLVRNAKQEARLRELTARSFAWETPEGCPDGLPLYRLVASDTKSLSNTISCHQEIASDGCFSLGMITAYSGPLEQHGAWFYPRLHWECGLIGQILYLEAEAAGVRGTGIGCFFDDLMHRTLGLKGREFQSLYHFTIGGPVDDTRLTMLPAYED